MIATRRFASRTFWLFSALVLASCFGEATGPDRRLGKLPLAPLLDARALRLVNVGSVHIRLLQPGTSTVVIDTTVVFPPGLDTLSLQLSVPISGTSQQFDLTLDMLDATNSVVFHAGPTSVTAAASGVPNPPVPLVFYYVGVGSKAAGVRFTSAPTSVFFGDSVTFLAEAFDSQSVTIPNTPILYLSSDSLAARVPSPAAGKVLALSKRGTVQITAQLLTPPNASKPLVVQPLPSAIAIVSGSGQSGPIGQPLAQPLIARVTAADNLGVQGVTVNFAVTAGGGSLSAPSAVTDTAGKAQVLWTLGGGAISQAVSATIAGLPAATTSFGATATSGPPKALFFTTQPPASPVAGSAFSVVVTARDTFGNTASTFTGNVTLALATNPGAAMLSGTLTVAAVAGVATFSNLSLDKAAAGYTIGASSSTLTGATSGAITVSAGAATTITPVSGNLQTTFAGTPDTNPIVVKVTDANGNAVAGRTVNWAVVTGGGNLSAASTVTDALGLTSVGWTTGTAAATQTAAATVGGLTGSPVTFTTLGMPSGTTNRWRGLTTDWNSSANWSAGSFPTAASNVFIPRVGAFAANSPVLTAAAVTLDLFTEPGSVLDLGAFGLTATGNVGAAAIVATGGGVLSLSGLSKTVAGSLPSVNTSGTYTLLGLTTVSGTLTLSGGNLTVGGQKLAVTGGFTVSASGFFTMTNAADTMVVGGNASIASGTSNSTGLTNGVMLVGGNFTQGPGSSLNFAASGNHKVVLTGTSAQAVSFANPGSSGFANLDIVNSSGGVSFTTPASASGSVAVLGPTNVTGLTSTMTIGGSLSDVSNTRWQVGHTSFSGTAPSLPDTITSNVTFSGAASLPKGFKVAGNDSLSVTNGNLSLNGHTVAVTGSMTVIGGAFTMTNAADTLVIGGNFSVVSSSSNSTGLTNGVMLVRGNFSQVAGSSLNFVGSGAHKVVLNGSAPQAVSFSNPTSASGFANLDIANTTGIVTFSTSAAVSGNVSVLPLANVQGTAVTLTVGGNLSDPSNLAWQIGHTVFTGSAPSLPDTIASNVTFTGAASLPKGFKVAGSDSLTVGNGNLNLNGKTVRVTGNFLVSGGVVTMQNASDLDSLIVTGNAKFSSNSSNSGGLAHGVMLIAGSFTQAAGSSNNFVGSGTHKVVLNGSVSQAVNISTPNSAVFQHLEVNNPAGAAFGTAFQVNGNLTSTAGNLTGAVLATLGGNLLDASGTRWQVQTTMITGATPTLPATMTTNLIFQPATSTTLQGRLGLTGNVVVAAGTLTMNGHAIVATGTLAVSGGVLAMTNALDTMRVAGAAAFTSNSSNNSLTAGVLIVGGNFSQAAGSSNNFAASGTHKTLLNGGSLQTVSFTTSGSSSFKDLEINNASGVTFPGSAQANGALTLTSGSIAGAGALTVVGNVTTAALTTVSIAGLTLGGSLTIGNPPTFTPNTVAFTGTGQTIPGTPLNYVNVVSTGPSVTFGGNVNLSGLLAVNNGNLTVGGKIVNVTGTLTVNGGTLTMNSASDSLKIGGAATFNSNTSNPNLTAGVLTVGGDFNQIAGSSLDFSPTIAHTTTFNGTGAQVVKFATPGTASGRFGNLDIRNTSAGGVRFNSNAEVLGTATVGLGVIAVGDTLGTRTIGIGGALVDASGGRWRSNTTVFRGSGLTAFPTKVTSNVQITPAAGTHKLIVGNGFTIDSNLTVVSDTFSLNGQTVNVGLGMSVTGGLFSMTQTASQLNVSGNFSVTSNSTNDSLTAGTLLLGSNFTQTAGSSNNFRESGSHRTVFARSVAGVQTISFSTPASSFFKRLELNRPGVDSIYLASDVQVIDSVDIKGRSVLASNLGTGNQALLMATTGVFRVHSGAVAPNRLRRVEAGVFFADSSGQAPGVFIAPDTAAFLLAGQAIPQSPGYSWQSIRVMDSVTSAPFGPANIAKDLVIGSATTTGRFEVPANSTLTVGGKLKTQGNGALRMTTANATIDVADSAIFGGGSTAGRLTAGVLNLHGNFVQMSGVSSATFAPSVGHVSVFNGAVPTSPATQTIFFQNPTTSFFDSLVIDRGPSSRGTVNLLSDVLVNRGMTIQNSSDLTGPTAHLKIAGGTLLAPISTTSPTITSLSSLEMSVAPVIGSSTLLVVAPDTAIYGGAIASLPTALGINYKSVRVGTTGTISLPGAVSLANDLLITSGTFNLGGSSLTVNGNLVTSGSGALGMPGSTITLTVGGNATFGGGSTAGLLTGGTLRLRGNFTQTGNPAAFQAASAHITLFEGAATQTVNFANPAASGASNFGNLFIERNNGLVSLPAGITLGSPIFVSGTLSDTSHSAVDSIYGGASGFTVNVGSSGAISLGSAFVMNNAPLTTNSGTLFTSGLTFNNMSPTVTQWTMNIPNGASIIFSGLSFTSTPTTGLYFAAQLSSIGAATLSVSAPVSPLAATLNLGALYKTMATNGIVTTTWGGTLLTDH